MNIIEHSLYINHDQIVKHKRGPHTSLKAKVRSSSNMSLFIFLLNMESQTNPNDHIQNNIKITDLNLEHSIYIKYGQDVNHQTGHHASSKAPICLFPSQYSQ